MDDDNSLEQKESLPQRNDKVLQATPSSAAPWLDPAGEWLLGCRRWCSTPSGSSHPPLSLPFHSRCENSPPQGRRKKLPCQRSSFWRWWPFHRRQACMRLLLHFLGWLEPPPDDSLSAQSPERGSSALFVYSRRRVQGQHPTKQRFFHCHWHRSRNSHSCWETWNMEFISLKRIEIVLTSRGHRGTWSSAVWLVRWIPTDPGLHLDSPEAFCFPLFLFPHCFSFPLGPVARQARLYPPPLQTWNFHLVQDSGLVWTVTGCTGRRDAFFPVCVSQTQACVSQTPACVSQTPGAGADQQLLLLCPSGREWVCVLRRRQILCGVPAIRIWIRTYTDIQYKINFFLIYCPIVGNVLVHLEDLTWNYLQGA